MSRHFTIPLMLRMTPNVLLQEFFQRLKAPLSSLEWPKLKERHYEPILAALNGLPREKLEQIESTLGDIFQLSCHTGWSAILDAAHFDDEQNFAASLPADATPYARAMWTWLNRPAIFTQAMTMHEIDGLTHWRKRSGLPNSSVRITPASIRELAAGMSSCLQREEGRGHNCTVEHFRRQDTDFFVAYPDDFVQTVTLHDAAGNLIPRPLRLTFEIVFALRSHEGTLELFARVNPAIKPKLEAVFGQVILGADLATKPSLRQYDLNRLKDRYFCLATDPADRVTAAISRVRLNVPNRGWFTVETKGKGSADDIYELLDDFLNNEKVVWPEFDINLATFRFTFDSPRADRAATVTFDVTYPDRCSIRSRHPERIELVRKYLRRWRIANV